MYTILINDDNTLTTSVRERIMERSNLMNSFRILVNPKYKISDESGYDNIPNDTETIDESESTNIPIVVNGIADMTRFTLLLEYISPISKKYHSEILNLTINEDGTPKTYKGKLEYKLPATTKITKESGNVEIKMSFTATDLSVDGNLYQYVRKTSTTYIPIIPISAWIDTVPDEAFEPIDQRLLKTDAQIKALEDLNEVTATTKADNIVLDEETNDIYLTADGVKIGDAININDLGTTLAENTKEGLIKMII